MELSNITMNDVCTFFCTFKQQTKQGKKANNIIKEDPKMYAVQRKQQKRTNSIYLDERKLFFSRTHKIIRIKPNKI